MLNISLFRVVPKKMPGEYRLIHHLSYLHGSSGNDVRPGELMSMQYTYFDYTAHLVARCGKVALMGKCNIKPIHSTDFSGFAFGGYICVVMALLMDSSISCTEFEKFSTFLEWAFRSHSSFINVAH